jgi:(2S)-methylsuccinyl-CoA dehydrogenase
MTAAARQTAPNLTADLLGAARAGLDAADRLVDAAKRGVAARVAASSIDAEQFAAHGFAWYATYVETLRHTLTWAEKLQAAGKLGESESLIVKIGFAEYLSQLAGGVMMSQNEFVRPADMGLDEGVVAAFEKATEKLRHAAGPADRQRLAELVAKGGFGDPGDDETMAMVRDQFRKFADTTVAPFAHDWHRKDELIPLPVVEEMGELGVFGLTVPEQYGGAGLGKIAMCIVSEELSRGYIGVGSLGTRAEIAAELLMNGGTEEQKNKWLPLIAGGKSLPTAVFTEPNTGSDLGSLRTRAVKTGDHYTITGNKTWITHAARADVMTLLARTNPDTKDYRGLSMFLAEKPRGTEGNPFPAEGMTGGEIRVLGYRGMKEYELGFDGFKVKAENLLGGVENQGFKQLMATFESARIQTGARALGVAQCAMELGLKYAQERIQFGQPIFNFPRVHGKIAMMAVETMMARQMTYAAAYEKDAGRRCDLEAGMAKLLGARIAWANADNALQIHGGNGYAEEYVISRVLCDARILNVFEGAAEIQAQVIARRLLETGRN